MTENSKPAQSDLSDQNLALIASKEWRSYIEPLVQIGEKSVARLKGRHDPQLRHELYRALFSQTAAAYLGVLHASAEHPDFWPWFSIAFNNLGPNPDDVFSLTPLDDDGTYKISGFRGTVRIVDFQFGTGTFIPRGTYDDPVYSKTLVNHDLDELSFNEDGSFEFILSATRPAGYDGHWWPLPEGTTYVLIRQIAYDWLHEVDARLAIDRIDRPAVKPRPGTAELDADMQRMSSWVDVNMAFSIDYVEGVRASRGSNHLDYINFEEFGGLTTQRYVNGTFNLEAGEALIIEADMPATCRYWSFQLVDDLFLSIDWMNRQTSLNGHTAHIDSDGVFRAVICAEDPGVPNWLDSAGYASGGIQGRWKEASSAPKHRTRKVKIAELRSFLPAETPVVSAEARDAAIRLRRKGVQLRRRW